MKDKQDDQQKMRSLSIVQGTDFFDPEKYAKILFHENCSRSKTTRKYTFQDKINGQEQVQMECFNLIQYNTI